MIYSVVQMSETTLKIWDAKSFNLYGWSDFSFLWSISDHAGEHNHHVLNIKKKKIMKLIYFSVIFLLIVKNVYLI